MLFPSYMDNLVNVTVLQYFDVYFNVCTVYDLILL